MGIIKNYFLYFDLEEVALPFGIVFLIETIFCIESDFFFFAAIILFLFLLSYSCLNKWWKLLLSGGHTSFCCWSLCLFFHFFFHCFLLFVFCKIYYPFDNIKILTVPLAQSKCFACWFAIRLLHCPRHAAHSCAKRLTSCSRFR